MAAEKAVAGVIVTTNVSIEFLTRSAPTILAKAQAKAEVTGNHSTDKVQVQDRMH